MVKLHSIGKIEFRVYAGDHRPAHFHVVAPDYEVQLDLATLSVINGKLPARDRRTVMAWIEANRDQLVAAWNRLNPSTPL